MTVLNIQEMNEVKGGVWVEIEDVITWMTDEEYELKGSSGRLVNNSVGFAGAFPKIGKSKYTIPVGSTSQQNHPYVWVILF